MWEEFGDIPINDNDEIEVDFYNWERGTNRFDIWEWFDKKVSGGVISLIYND